MIFHDIPALCILALSSIYFRPPLFLNHDVRMPRWIKGKKARKGKEEDPLLWTASCVGVVVFMCASERQKKFFSVLWPCIFVVLLLLF
jgi:hypothetical protein